jgi:hypothetical protein
MAAVHASAVPVPYSRDRTGDYDFMTGASVTVTGMGNDMGGLKESLTAFRKHHKEVGAALLNISGVGTVTGGPVDKDEERPAYRHQEWPIMLYHADGREVIVGDPDAPEGRNKADIKAHLDLGFRREPYVKPQIQVLDPATEKKELLATNRQLQAQITLMNEQLQKLAADRK